MDPITTRDATFWFCSLLDGMPVELPWGDAEFDAFVVLLDDALEDPYLDAVVSWVAAAKTDWVEVFGAGAEAIHDRVDASAAEAGRQEKVGDGQPMTAWWEGFGEEGVEHLVSGGHGASEHKLVVWLGEAGAGAEFLERARARMRVG